MNGEEQAALLAFMISGALLGVVGRWMDTLVGFIANEAGRG